MSLLKELRRAFSEHALTDNTAILVGVSGGVDSLVLLHALAQLRDVLQLSLVAATLDHGLRGEAGAADAAFVEETARAWGIPCERGAVDVAALAAERRMSIEQAARHARYRFLGETAYRLGIRQVAVAHHADDQSETVLLHLLRGSGISGLKGMAWSAPLPGSPALTLIRPLLNIRRADIEAYARENGLTPRVDATNDDTAYARNKIRHEVLPLLRQINAGVDAVLIRLADSASVDDDYLTQQLAGAIEGQADVQAGRISLAKAVFRTLPPALQRRYLLWCAQKLKSEMPNSSGELPLSYERALASAAAVCKSDVGTVIELGGGLNLRVDYEQFYIELADADVMLPDDTPLIKPDIFYDVQVPGSTALDGWQLDIKREAPPNSESVPVYIPSGAEVSIRNRKTGDRFRIKVGQGRAGTRLVSRWMVDSKIPRALREYVPLLVIDSQIAAILWRKIVLNPDFVPTVDDDPKFLYHMSLVRH